MDPEHLLSYRLISDVQLNARGDAAAYVVSRVDVEADVERSPIWVARVRDGLAGRARCPHRGPRPLLLHVHGGPGSFLEFDYAYHPHWSELVARDLP
jgi:dipeptidyl aminopeptidase/acylaminoacyl peptidase